METPGEIPGGNMEYFSGTKTYNLEDLVKRFAETNKDKDIEIPDEFKGLVD